MSNKFTGITSAGSAIPVYDKEAHQALSAKLDASALAPAISGKADTSAIPSLDGYATEQWVGEQGYLTSVPESAVSGFATHEEVESATSGKADKNDLGDYVPRSGIGDDLIFTQVVPLGLDLSAKGTTASSYGSYGVTSVNMFTTSAGHYVNSVSLASTGLTGQHSAYVSNNSGSFELRPSKIYIGSAGGEATIEPSQTWPLSIRCSGNDPAYFIFDRNYGLAYSAANTGIGKFNVIASADQSVPRYNPVLSAVNASGDGFTIGASEARGFDKDGNTIWSTKMSKASQLIHGSNDPNPAILLTPMPATPAYSAQWSNAPYISADYQSLTISYGPTANVPNIKMMSDGLTAQILTGNSARAQFGVNAGGAKYETSAGSWSLTGSVQKREIECDSATSAITAIAGSAIGGKEYSAGANIDITDEVISGKDWSEDIISATSGLQPSGDYYSASNPSGFLTEHQSLAGYMQTSGLEYDGDKISGYMGSAFKAGDELPVIVSEVTDYVSATSGDINATIDNVSSNSGAWGGSALPISAGPGIKFNMVNGTLVASTDETVLWTGNNSDTSFTLSEPISNFKVIELYNEKNTNSCRILVDGTVSAGFNYNRLWLQPDNTIMQRYYAVTSNDGQTFGVRYVRGADISTAGATTYDGGEDWYLENTKIVGIGRVAGGI